MKDMKHNFLTSSELLSSNLSEFGFGIASWGLGMLAMEGGQLLGVGLGGLDGRGFIYCQGGRGSVVRVVVVVRFRGRGDCGLLRKSNLYDTIKLSQNSCGESNI